MGKDDLTTWLELKGVPQYKENLRQGETATRQFGDKTAQISTAAAAAWAFVGMAAYKAVGRIKAAMADLATSHIALEHKMAEVWTLADVGKDTIRDLTASFRQLSTQVPKSTVDLAQASYNMVSAGVAIEKSGRAVALAGKAATAGVTDTATAVMAGMAAVNSYSLAIEELERVYDIQFATVKKGVLNYQELAAAMGTVFPVAAQLKVKLSDLYGAVAFLTTQGQKADVATTNLGAALTAMIDNAKKMEDLGVPLYTVEGEFRGLLEIIRDLDTATRGSTRHRVEMLNEMGLAERRAFRAIGPMIDKIQTLDEFLEQVGDSAGMMGTAFEKVAQDTESQFTLLKNTLRVLGEEAWEPWIENARRLAEQTNKDLGALLRAGEFQTTAIAAKRISTRAALSLQGFSFPQTVYGTTEEAKAWIENAHEMLRISGEMGKWKGPNILLGGLTPDDIATIKDALPLVVEYVDALERQAEVLKSLSGLEPPPIPGPSDEWLRGVGISRPGAVMPGPEPGPRGVPWGWEEEGLPRQMERAGQAASQATEQYREWWQVSTSLFDEIGQSGVYAFSAFGSTVAGHANLAGMAFHQMTEQILADIGRLIARLIALKAVAWIAGVLGLGGGSEAVSASVSVASGSPPVSGMISGPRIEPAERVTVVVHNAHPDTYVELTDNVIAPRYEYLKRHRIAEGG